MSGRSEEIRVSDLAQPVLTPEQQNVQDIVSRMPVSLEEGAVLDAAREKTGLSDFGPEDFRVRLRIWLAAAEEDETLGPLGRARVFGDCVRYAANRLRLRPSPGTEWSTRLPKSCTSGSTGASVQAHPGARGARAGTEPTTDCARRQPRSLNSTPTAAPAASVPAGISTRGWMMMKADSDRQTPECKRIET